MKRSIKIIATYDLNSSNVKGTLITPKEIVEAMVKEEIFEFFGYDEGFTGINVEVIDE